MRIKHVIVTLDSKYNAELNIAHLFRTHHCCDGKHALVTKLLHGCIVLQFGDQFDLSADIPTGAWGFPLSHPDTPQAVGNLSKISLLTPFIQGDPTSPF